MKSADCRRFPQKNPSRRARCVCDHHRFRVGAQIDGRGWPSPQIFEPWSILNALEPDDDRATVQRQVDAVQLGSCQELCGHKDDHGLKLAEDLVDMIDPVGGRDRRCHRADTCCGRGDNEHIEVIAFDHRDTIALSDARSDQRGHSLDNEVCELAWCVYEALVASDIEWPIEVDFSATGAFCVPVEQDAYVARGSDLIVASPSQTRNPNTSARAANSSMPRQFTQNSCLRNRARMCE